jgi:hypothetical protein
VWQIWVWIQKRKSNSKKKKYKKEKISLPPFPLGRPFGPISAQPRRVLICAHPAVSRARLPAARALAPCPALYAVGSTCKPLPPRASELVVHRPPPSVAASNARENIVAHTNQRVSPYSNHLRHVGARL